MRFVTDGRALPRVVLQDQRIDHTKAIEMAKDLFEQMHRYANRHHLNPICYELHLGGWSKNEHLHSHIIMSPQRFFYGRMPIKPQKRFHQYVKLMNDKEAEYKEFKLKDSAEKTATVPDGSLKLGKFQCLPYATVTADPHEEGLSILRFSDAKLNVVLDFLNERGFDTAQVRIYPDQSIHLVLPVRCFRAVIEYEYSLKWERKFEANPNPVFRATLPLGNPP